MKKNYISLVILAAAFTAQAQTTAQDWTKNDCDGRSHNLFAELDSGNVVVLEYVMMNCGSCVTAANGLKNITAPYTTSHPGRVRMYSIGYTNSYSCTQMNNWKTTNNFTHPVFTNGAADVAYYGGMGMPTIVIVGNNTHTVYYKKLGYSSSDNAAITAAINQALAVTNPAGLNEAAKLNIQLYPNPVQHSLNLTFEQGRFEQIRITDLTGRLIFNRQFAKTDAKAQVNTSEFPVGLYLVHFLKDGEVVATKKFVKTEKE